jgi:hypothetical protein
MPSQATTTAWENGRIVPTTGPKFSDSRPRTEKPSLVAVRRLVGLLLADTSPALGIECVALVTGIGYDGSSMEQIAKRHGVTRAAVSKRCIELCEAFGVPPVRAMRTEKNRAHCRLARLLSLTHQ